MRTLLHSGTIVDGTSSPAKKGDLLMEDTRIAAVGTFEVPPEAVRVDCTGLIIAPGFIDGHSHADLHLFGECTDKMRQGVTAEVVGNCGFSPYPIGDHPAALREFANGILYGDGAWGWESARGYLDAVGKGLRRVEVASLVGHGSLRIAVAGNRAGRLDEHEVARMESILDEMLAEGACGFSTGLMYGPGDSAPTHELERLCRVVARRGKTYTSHMRSYASGLVDAVDEQIQLAKCTGCRLQISHLQAVGAANWPRQAPAIERIEKAAAEGVDIAFDCYPYIAGSTVLTQALPQWTLEGGMSAMVARLSDPDLRRTIAKEIERISPWRWQDIRISAVGSEKNRSAVGKTLASLAEIRSMEPVEVMFSLLIEEHGDVNMLCFNQSEDNLRETLTHPMSIVISDGFYVRGKPHPRLMGTFPNLLGEFSRERQWLTLEDAVHKITAKPARRFGLQQRGILEPGFQADVTIFDPREIASAATYDEPETPPKGVRGVYRLGRGILP